MSEILIEASQNGATFNELMWAHIPPPADPDALPRPFRVDSFIIHRSDQPAGTYAARGRSPNYPHRASSASVGLAAMATSPLGKVYFRDTKEAVANHGTDLTYYYKVQRVDRKGNIHPDDTVLADLTPRIIPSFEETVGSYPIDQFGYPTQEYVRTFAVANGSTFVAGDSVFDFIKRFGQPASTIELTAAGVGVTVARNNINNDRVALPASAVDVPYRLGPGNVWTYRLWFENTSGGDINVTIRAVVGVQP